MVAIADDFRARWEATDEFRKIDELEALAAWLGTIEVATDSEPIERPEITV